MPGPLKQEVESRLPWFHELGFHVTGHNFSPKHMGGSIVELQSDSLRVRFVRDRGIYTEVASVAEPDGWFDLGFLWYALTGDRPEPELEGWAWFFRDHLPQLAEALGRNMTETKRQYAERREESREILARYLPPNTLVARIRRFKATALGMLLLGPLGWVIAAALIYCRAIH